NELGTLPVVVHDTHQRGLGRNAGDPAAKRFIGHLRPPTRVQQLPRRAPPSVEDLQPTVAKARPSNRRRRWTAPESPGWGGATGRDVPLRSDEALLPRRPPPVRPQSIRPRRRPRIRWTSPAAPPQRRQPSR